MKSIRYFFVLCILLAASTTAAKTANAEDSSKKRGLAFSFGTYVSNISEMNSELGANGIAETPEWFYSIGLISKRSIKENIFLELDGNVLIGKEAGNSLYKSSLLGSKVVAGMSYLRQGNSIDCFPTIGVGVGFTRLHIADNSSSEYSFDEALSNPEKELSALNSSLLIDIGFSMEYKIKRSQNKGKGFRIGAKIGYQFAPLVSEWNMGENELAGGPDVGINGYYLKMTIGKGKYN